MIYFFTFFTSLVLVAIWHGSVWRKYGRIAPIHKMVANALKAFLWACNAILYYYHEYPHLFRLGADWFLHVGPVLLSAFVFQACVWWAAFDILVNVIGGRPAFHLGRTALTDRVFSEYWEKIVTQIVFISVSGLLLVWADSMIQ